MTGGTVDLVEEEGTWLCSLGLGKGDFEVGDGDEESASLIISISSISVNAEPWLAPTTLVLARSVTAGAALVGSA